jgi:ubiquinone/menaquinone biosynthesis C-methylase UbiE
MAERQIVFDDGVAYEKMMGTWSRIAGDLFLDWLAPPSGLRWVDIGCGNGAFTERLVERCAPAEVQGVDPSPEQLSFARGRPAARLAKFQQGDAMALPFADNSFDAAVMALVLFFVPNPDKGLAEMVRVVKPGGLVAVYVWDVVGGGMPHAPIGIELRAMGINTARPPSFEVSRMDALQRLWSEAGLEGIETRVIEPQRTFANFDEFWAINMLGPVIGPTVRDLTPAKVEELRTRVRARLPADSTGRITCSARANAISGRRPT